MHVTLIYPKNVVWVKTTQSPFHCSYPSPVAKYKKEQKFNIKFTKIETFKPKLGIYYYLNVTLYRIKHA